MDVLESSFRDGEVADGRDGVARYFCLLARETLPRPLCDVRVERRPNHLCADGLTCPLDARMPESMDDVKHLLPECQRDKRSSGTVAAVHDKIVPPDADVFEVKTGSSIVPEPSEVWVERLLHRYGVPIDAHVGDGVDDAGKILSCGLGACGCAGVDRRGDW